MSSRIDIVTPRGYRDGSPKERMMRHLQIETKQRSLKGVLRSSHAKRVSLPPSARGTVHPELQNPGREKSFPRATRCWMPRQRSCLQRRERQKKKPTASTPLEFRRCRRCAMRFPDPHNAALARFLPRVHLPRERERETAPPANPAAAVGPSLDISRTTSLVGQEGRSLRQRLGPKGVFSSIGAYHSMLSSRFCSVVPKDLHSK